MSNKIGKLAFHPTICVYVRVEWDKNGSFGNRVYHRQRRKQNPNWIQVTTVRNSRSASTSVVLLSSFFYLLLMHPIPQCNSIWKKTWPKQTKEVRRAKRSNIICDFSIFALFFWQNKKKASVTSCAMNICAHLKIHLFIALAFDIWFFSPFYLSIFQFFLALQLISQEICIVGKCLNCTDVDWWFQFGIL